MATEAMQTANLTFHSADISDQRATMILPTGGPLFE
jgi:hypothetical protein